ncbi:MAG TPA: hypothetical protein VF306_07130, partial [Pirellulales bacterium]
NLAGGDILGGTITASGGAALVMTASSTLDGVTLDADLSVPDNSALTVKDGLTLNGTLTMTHSGTYNLTLVNFSGTQTLGGTGTVQFVNTNNYASYNNVLQPVDGGTLTIGPGITIHGQRGTVGAPGDFFGSTPLPLVNQGTIEADAAGQTILVTGSSVTNSGTLAASGGKLSVSGLASPMAGTLSAGVGGVISINGNLTIDPAGIVNVDLGGAAAGQFGQIQVTGATTLGGTLNLALAGGYQPASGDSLKIITFTSHTGTFATVNGASISANLVWAPVYESQDVMLVAGSPQLADVAAPDGSKTPSLPPSQESEISLPIVSALEQAAIDHWEAAGLDPRLVALLRSVDVSIADLGNDVLAITAGNHIILSDDADGYGWFADPIAPDHGDFAPTSNDHVFSALAGTGAAGRFDLLTVIDHELGHVLGLPDQMRGDDLMQQLLAPGVRKTPSNADIDAASGGE